MEKEVRERRFALSLSQHNIWDLECIIPGTSVNNISTTIRIRGRVDMVALQESIYRVLETDASLRTRLTLEDGVPVQYHAPFFREDFPVYDFSGSGGQGLESWEKADTPVLSYYSVKGEYGPGHHSFFVDDQGERRIAYHAEDALHHTIRCDGIRRVHFDVEGRPRFDLSAEESLDPDLRQVEIQVKVI